MLLIKLWNYIKGYVIIKISGEYTERLLNKAAVEGILLWDVQCLSDKILIAKIGIKDFFRLSRMARKTHNRISIIQRAGFLFLLKKLLRRKIFIAGGIVFILAIYFLSSLIWSIEVISEDPKIKASVVRNLPHWGVERGKRKSTVDKQLLVDRILTKHKDISWAQVYFKGSKAVIELVKKNMPPEFEDTGPGDIIASKDGIIEEVIPFKGEAVVKPGDTVSVGDILISGKSLYKIGEDPKGLPLYEEELVSAQGIVKARVWYQRVVKVPLLIDEQRPTGAQRKKYTLHFGNRQWEIPLAKVSFHQYDIDPFGEFHFFGRGFEGIRLDISLLKELETVEKSLTINEASNIAEVHLNQELASFDTSRITQKKIEYILDAEEKAVIGSLTAEIVEEIGQRVPLIK